MQRPDFLNQYRWIVAKRPTIVSCDATLQQDDHSSWLQPLSEVLRLTVFDLAAATLGVFAVLSLIVVASQPPDMILQLAIGCSVVTELCCMFLFLRWSHEILLRC